VHSLGTAGVAYRLIDNIIIIPVLLFSVRRYWSVLPALRVATTANIANNNNNSI